MDGSMDFNHINGTEPIFEDVTRELDIDDDVKQLVRQYSLLNDSDRELVKRMIISLAEKIDPNPDQLERQVK